MNRPKELDERIAWVLANRPHLIVRGKPSEREWSRLARHANGEPFGNTQVNMMRIRIKKWLDDPTAGKEPSWELETLEALADAAHVNRTWFAQGIGSPDISTTEPVERYTAMPIVRRMALEEGFDPEFVRTFEALLDADEQPKPSELWNLMQAAYARHQRKVLPQGDPLADLDEPRPPPKRRSLIAETTMPEELLLGRNEMRDKSGPTRVVPAKKKPEAQDARKKR